MELLFNSFSASQVLADSFIEKVALMSAFSALLRVTSPSLREPSANESASMRIDLPAPVSPVSVVKPLENSKSSASTIIKSRMERACSMN
jgi:hypothetical protein